MSTLSRRTFTMLLGSSFATMMGMGLVGCGSGGAASDDASTDAASTTEAAGYRTLD